MMQNYEVGSKVVPFKKTVYDYGKLEDSSAWNNAQRNGQYFLYVSDFDADEGFYLLSHKEGDIEGSDFFNEDDFYTYDEMRYSNHLDSIENGEFGKALILSPLSIDLNSTTPMPSYGDILSLNEFIDMCESGSLIDYDGYGDIIYNEKVVYKSICPSDLNFYEDQLIDLQKKLGKIQIMWYNK